MMFWLVQDRDGQEVYGWLVPHRHRIARRDRAFVPCLEVEAFLEVHRRWKRRVIFETSGALIGNCPGSSGDRPAALRTDGEFDQKRLAALRPVVASTICIFLPARRMRCVLGTAGMKWACTSMRWLMWLGR